MREWIVKKEKEEDRGLWNEIIEYLYFYELNMGVWLSYGCLYVCVHTSLVPPLRETRRGRDGREGKVQIAPDHQL